MPAKRSHLEERARDPARTAGLRARVDVKGGRWLALAVKEEKELAFFRGGLSLALPASADL